MTDRGSPSNVVGTSTKSVELECVAEGFPAPKIVWTREDGRPLEDDSGRVSAVGGVVTFREVERADEGFYSVKATNAEGVTMAKVKVEVMYPARLVEIMFIGPLHVYNQLICI